MLNNTKLGQVLKRRTRFGFTLIELLIVIGILTLILSITLIAINPIEQFRRANDVTRASVVKDFVSAAKYYYISEKTTPWEKDASCKNELRTGRTLSDIPSCAQQLIGGGQTQTDVLSSNEAKNVYVTECSGAVAVCYSPKSQQFNKAGEAKYASNGVIRPGCPGGDDCYACTFSTNEAQECFQALNPNGSLAIVPSPSPDQPLPIPDRSSESTCSDPAPGQASCMAEVVTDSQGNPLSSLALPGGFGPAQIHTAYNLPCTPGGTVNATCSSPTTFGPQTIAIVIAYHTQTLESDLAIYNQTYNLPPCTVANGCLTVVNQNGTTTPPVGQDASWSLEASMDVQIAHATCQTCKILLVEATSNSFTDMGIAVNRAAQMGATAISNSWGANDWSNENAYDTYFDHPGVFVTASSGDSGYGGSYPASSKHVIAVGGTTLSLLANNTYASESVWSGAGSGCAAYQTANAFQTVVPNWVATGCGTKRGIADVAAVANPSTGAAVYDSTPYSGRSGWWIVGGTSLSSPIVASALAMNADAPSGVVASSYVYQNPQLFRDVTSGSNGSCGGTTICKGAVGYDGPTGLGTPNFNPLPSNTTPTETPIPSPAPSSTPSPSPTPVVINCGQVQTVTLTTSSPILALPGDTVNNVLSIKNNSSVGCSTLFTISRGGPSGWTFTGIPASVTVAGGATATIPFTVAVPLSATAGNYPYQFWVARPGESSPNATNGSIQVAEVGPTNTPTPTPINCFQGWSNSLGSTSLSGNAGDTINQSLTITYNNPPSCGGSAQFAISHSYPTGWIINNLPPSVTLTPGQSITIPFTITISTGAQVQDYLMQYWVNSGGLPMNATVHVLKTATPPEQQMFSNFNVKAYGTYALFEYSYNAQGAVSGRLDVSTDPNGLNTTTAPAPAGTYYGFAYNYGSAMDASNNPIPSSVRGFIVSSPQSWSGWTCGRTIYYRMYNDGDKRIKSPVQSTVVDCNTVVDVLPWNPWYAAIYQGVYDSRYDADHNGVVNWTDYWILVRATRLR